MIPAGLVNALFQWATGDVNRTTQLVTERDALIAAFLSGGQPAVTLTGATSNGKTFAGMVSLSAEDKLSLLTTVLEQLGEIDPASTSVTYGNFTEIRR